MRRQLSNGTLNGYAHIGPLKTLVKLAEHHEHKARALRSAIEVFIEDRSLSKRVTAKSMINGAIALDGERRATRPTQTTRLPKHKRPGYHVGKERMERRQRTADLLSHFDATTPKPLPEGRGKRNGIAALLRFGFLKKRSKGYIRTAKPFVVGGEGSPAAK